MLFTRSASIWRQTFPIGVLNSSNLKSRQFSSNDTTEKSSPRNPTLAGHQDSNTAPPKVDHKADGQSVASFTTDHPPTIDYGHIKLSQENLMVDTYALVKALRSQGFTQEQSECITYSFTQILNDAIREQRKLCVEKAALDIMREQVMSHVAALRKDMVILEKSELSDLRNENEKLKLLLQQTKSQITEDVNHVKNQLTLDINMERSRAKDDFVTTEKSIAALTTKMTAELGNLETTFERYKNDIYKFIAGTLASALTLGLGIYRILKA